MSKKAKQVLVVAHKAIKGSVHIDTDGKVVDTTTPAIQHKLWKLDVKDNKIEPVEARLTGGHKLSMERILGTTHYLSHGRKMIYDVAFADLYLHTGKIPENHLAVDNMLLVVQDYCHIDEKEKFLQLLNKENESAKGTQFYIDGVLYISNVPFMKAEEMRNTLLRERNDGMIPFFSVLKIQDPSGNVTEFHTKLTEEQTITRRKNFLKESKEAHRAVRGALLYGRD